MRDLTILVISIQWVVLAYLLLLNTLYFGFSIFAFFSLVAYQRRAWKGDIASLLTETASRPISVLVPAYNEKETIAANIRSLLTLSYPEFEIVVVNDGSSDDTIGVLRRAFDLVPVPAAFRVQLPTKTVKAMYRSLDHPNLLVVDKENGGKSDALNAAINASNYPLFCCIDADSLLEPDALLRVARVFAEDDAVVAVGGIVRVLNGSKVEDGRVTDLRTSTRPIVLHQTLEYVRGFLAGRTALGAMGSLLIISGAFGVFRKAPMVAAGGYSAATVCEDMEVVVRLHHQGKAGARPKVVFVPDPVCWTQVPEDWRSLLRQRDRWQRGLLETLWIHHRMLFNPRHGVVGLFGFPFYVFFEALGPVIETGGYAFVAVLYAVGLVNVRFAVLFLILAVLYGITITLSALILDDLLFRRYERPVDLARLVLAAFTEYLGFRQLLAIQRAQSFVSVFFKEAQWGKVVRKAIANRERSAARSGEA